MPAIVLRSRADYMSPSMERDDLLEISRAPSVELSAGIYDELILDRRGFGWRSDCRSRYRSRDRRARFGSDLSGLPGLARSSKSDVSTVGGVWPDVAASVGERYRPGRYPVAGGIPSLAESWNRLAHDGRTRLAQTMPSLRPSLRASLSLLA